MLTAPPLDADTLLAPLLEERSLLLAVSGGPDSVALMHLAAGWSGRSGRAIAVATVDHGLRAESRAEAEAVQAAAAALGFAHHLLEWTGDKPSSRLQERAREARYALLSACARRIGAGAIVTAHHADDQEETILFRLTRGSGVAGLAGMAARTQVHGVALLRPLLGVGKADLVAYGAAVGAAHAIDPSNDNPAFARVRLRGLAKTLDAEGLSRAALLRLGARAAQAEAALAVCAAAAAEAALVSRSADETRFESGKLRHLPQELVQRIFAAEIVRFDTQATIRLDRLERAAQRLLHADGQTTLAGAILAFSARDCVISRAPPRRPLHLREQM